nr:autorepressor SdpR family transcription factor [uncultured Caproiciproducens sp.]
MSFPETFKALSDPTRREILSILKDGALPAGEICEHFHMTGATVSHHLSILKNADLVTDRRSGKFIYYELNLSVFEEVLNWFHSFVNKENNNDEK